jgi:hypothetical protein
VYQHPGKVEHRASRVTRAADDLPVRQAGLTLFPARLPDPFTGRKYLIFNRLRALGDALKLHPVTVLVALIFFGMIRGINGAFLAMPMTGVIRIVFDMVPATRPLAAPIAGDLDILSRPTASAENQAARGKAFG